MAENLKARLPTADKLIIYDVNKDALASFAKDNPSGVQIATSMRDVADESVSISTLPCHQTFTYPTMMNYFVLSMI